MDVQGYPANADARNCRTTKKPMSRSITSLALVLVAKCPAWCGLAVLCGSISLIAFNPSLASEVQQATNRAAIEAKRELCVALNNRKQNGGGDDEELSRLKNNFFAFYEGTRVAANSLSPARFRIGQIGPLPSFRVMQVLGPNRMLATIGSHIFIVKDVNTGDVANGQDIALRSFFYVLGTDTYNTVGGSTNTVYVLEPAGNRINGTNASRVYPWYNRTNEVVVTGEFREINGSKAVFLVNGHETSFSLTKFTAGDRELMRVLADRYPAEKPAEKPTEKPPEKRTRID